jgi:hypothetical protein
MNYAADKIHKESEQKVIKRKSRSKAKVRRSNNHDESLESESTRL